MIIERNHPHYKVRIEPEDENVLGTKFGDVPFTQNEFEFNYSDKVKEKDIPDALSKVFGIKKSIVMEAWDTTPDTGGGQNLK